MFDAVLADLLSAAVVLLIAGFFLQQKAFWAKLVGGVVLLAAAIMLIMNPVVISLATFGLIVFLFVKAALRHRKMRKEQEQRSGQAGMHINNYFGR